ncbi:MAG: hypothetical protein LBN38_02360 [Verrucomicrobiota bacterium]|jgi:L-arabinokinase|nr:hypothetical protein [Verrucomicrobiota bacterium]
MSSVKQMAYYITAHGYGHGVRSCDVLNALLAGDSPLHAVIVTDLPEDFLRNRLRVPSERYTIRPGAWDIGMVQKDSIRVDVDATRERAEALIRQSDAGVEREAEFLKRLGASVVVADIPSLPLQAAARAGLPALAMGNFSWDWIYAPFAARDARWVPIVDWFRQGYREADLLLKLPFSPEMDVFRRRKALPLLASPGVPDRARLASMTGARPQKRWVLLSFTTLAWDAAALQRVEALDENEFFTVRPLAWPNRRNIHAVERAQMTFSDVLASVDAVVSKPGYGLLSDCVANAKPLVYAERENFVEYPLLERELKRVVRNVHLPAADLYAGRLADALAAVAEAPPPPQTIALGGAPLAADEIRKAMER